MPIYEYRCKACEAQFSHFFRTVKAAEASDAPACPGCGSSDVQRLVSRVATLTDNPAAERAEREAAKPAPSPLYGRKEIQEQMRQERNRRSIARVSED
jgi:putative FmdB family regulatory protein